MGHCVSEARVCLYAMRINSLNVVLEASVFEFGCRWSLNFYVQLSDIDIELRNRRQQHMYAYIDSSIYGLQHVRWFKMLTSSRPYDSLWAKSFDP